MSESKYMKALVKKYSQPGIWMDDVPIPEIGIDDVLIKIIKTSICGTDIHIYKWDEWAQKNITPPLVIGHEYVGTV
ncbi:MAG: alcohol dehydrogenase catalytic domain-containing protein, partial [Eubacteriales bacterium]|nr:alcohol dehydrogenase catalytic domain-containing protein [Eubacteriales bacterium]